MLDTVYEVIAALSVLSRTPIMAKLSGHRAALHTHAKQEADCCSTCYSKCYLLFLNSLAVVFGILIVYFGATRLSVSAAAQIAAATNGTSNATGTVERAVDKALVSEKAALLVFENAWVNVVVFGVIITIISVFGLIGTYTRKIGIMFAYLVMLMVCSACLIYSSFFCYFFADQAKLLVDSYWAYLKEGLPEDSKQDDAVLWVENHTRGAAALCLIAAGMLLTAVWATSQFLGVLFTFRSFMNVVNAATSILGLLVILVSVMTAVNHLGGQWVPYLLAALGAMMSCLSTLGYCAVRKESLRMMQTYFCSLTILILLFLIASILSFYYASTIESYLKRNWGYLEPRIAPGFTEKDVEILLQHHMNKLGIAAAVVVVVLIFNCCGSLYMWRVIRREEMALNDEELEVLRLEGGVLEDSDNEESA